MKTIDLLEVIKDSLISETAFSRADRDKEKIELTHLLMLQWICALRELDVGGATEEGREAFHSFLFFGLVLVAFDFDQLQLDGLRQIKVDPELCVQVFCKSFFSKFFSHSRLFVVTPLAARANSNSGSDGVDSLDGPPDALLLLCNCP